MQAVKAAFESGHSDVQGDVFNTVMSQLQQRAPIGEDATATAPAIDRSLASSDEGAIKSYVPMAAALVKRYLRELAQPIVPASSYAKLLEIARATSVSQRGAGLRWLACDA